MTPGPGTEIGDDDKRCNKHLNTSKLIPNHPICSPGEQTDQRKYKHRFSFHNGVPSRGKIQQSSGLLERWESLKDKLVMMRLRLSCRLRINMIDGGQIVLYVMYKWCKYVLMV